MTGTAPINSAKAFETFTEHPRYKYRGCAPDVDDPTRAAGDLSLSRNAWITDDRDGAEPSKERKAREAAAVEVCLNCPVMVLCDAYANSVRPDGRLAEPRWVWGGRTALERHRRFIGHRHEVVVAPVERVQAQQTQVVMTEQKLRVLQALAVFQDPWEVARAAGMDWRTASWQRSRLVTYFGLARTEATRAELLRAAVKSGLLRASVVVDDDGSVPAVPPPPPRMRGRSAAHRCSGPHARSASWGRGDQLSLDDALEPSPPVIPLYPSAALLEAVA